MSPTGILSSTSSDSLIMGFLVQIFVVSLKELNILTATSERIFPTHVVNNILTLRDGLSSNRRDVLVTQSQPCGRADLSFMVTTFFYTCRAPLQIGTQARTVFSRGMREECVAAWLVAHAFSSHNANDSDALLPRRWARVTDWSLRQASFVCLVGVEFAYGWIVSVAFVA